MGFVRPLLSAFLAACLIAVSLVIGAHATERNLAVAAAPLQPASEPRIALVIGNSDYPNAPLANPVNDARAIAARLAELRFRVTRLENASQAQMYDAIRAFGDQLRDGGVGLFYYAGHALQVRGRNYLLPARTMLEREDELIYRTVDTGQILDKMESARNRVNVVILDACRSSPFGREFRNVTPGLAVVDAPYNTLIAFATAPGAVASDGSGRNGLYTQHLLQALASPGLGLEDVFKRVRTGVRQDSAGRQVPWENTSLEVDFFFDPLPNQIAAAAPATPDPLTLELVFWESVKGSTDPADYRAYLKRYPDGQFAVLASNRLRVLTAPAAPAIAAPVPTTVPPRPAEAPAPAPVAPSVPSTLAATSPAATATATTPVPAAPAVAASSPGPAAPLRPTTPTAIAPTQAAAPTAAPASTAMPAPTKPAAAPPATAAVTVSPLPLPAPVTLPAPSATPSLAASLAPSTAPPASGATAALVPLRVLTGHAGEVLAMAVSRSGHLALTGAADRSLRQWDLASGRELRRFSGHAAAVTAVAFAPDPRFVLSGSADRSVRLWDVASGAELARLAGHGAAVSAIAFDPTARYAASAADDGDVMLWALPGGALMRRAGSDGRRVRSLAFSPEGRHLLTASEDGSVRLWDVGSLRVLRRYGPLSAAAVTAAFSADGRRVSAVDARGEVWSWETHGGALLQRFAAGGPSPSGAAIASDGASALTAGPDGQLALWEIASARPLWRASAAGRRFSAVALGPRGVTGLAAGDDLRLLLWTSEP